MPLHSRPSRYIHFPLRSLDSPLKTRYVPAIPRRPAPTIERGAAAPEVPRPTPPGQATDPNTIHTRTRSAPNKEMPRGRAGTTSRTVARALTGQLDYRTPSRPPGLPTPNRPRRPRAGPKTEPPRRADVEQEAPCWPPSAAAEARQGDDHQGDDHPGRRTRHGRNHGRPRRNEEQIGLASCDDDLNHPRRPSMRPGRAPRRATRSRQPLNPNADQPAGRPARRRQRPARESLSPGRPPMTAKPPRRSVSLPDPPQFYRFTDGHPKQHPLPLLVGRSCRSTVLCPTTYW